MKYALALLIALTGCDRTPAMVDVGDISANMVLQRYNVVCKGLEMRDVWTREYATKQLVTVRDHELPTQCVCEFAIDEETGAWDESILRGLASSGRSDMAECFLPAMSDPRVENRAQLISALVATGASVMAQHMETIINDPAESAEMRAEVVESLALCETPDRKAMMTQLMLESDAPQVRASIAERFICDESEAHIATMVAVATDDPDGSVRAAAFRALDRLDGVGSVDLLCEAMMTDESAEARRTAVELFRAPRNSVKGGRETVCLRRRALAEEESALVREAVLDSLGSSPRQDAADVLCEAIPFWVATYVDDVHPDRMVGTNIVSAQNERDYPNSPRCLRQAYAQRGRYTCKGAQYVAAWARELGQTVSVPNCDGQ
jgi:hypothetical protein